MTKPASTCYRWPRKCPHADDLGCFGAEPWEIGSMTVRQWWPLPADAEEER